ncbi:MAG: PEP-CTERM sorting domain-containing protein [Phycisphaerales bacterium]
MNKATLCLFGGTLLGAGLSGQAAADIAFDGSLSQSYSLFGSDNAAYGPAFSYGPTSIDAFTFFALGDGQVQLDVFSFGMFDNWIDSQLYLFESVDGNFVLSDTVAVGEEVGVGNDLNGSSFVNDEFIDVFLTAGEYTVVIGGNATRPEDIELGTSLSLLFGNNGLGVPLSGQYRIDVIGNVAVPTPGALSLLGVGGLAIARRRR